MAKIYFKNAGLLTRIEVVDTKVLSKGVEFSSFDKLQLDKGSTKNKSTYFAQKCDGTLYAVRPVKDVESNDLWCSEFNVFVLKKLIKSQ